MTTQCCSIFDKNTRINNTKYIVNNISKLLKYLFENNAGYLVIMFHTLITFIPFSLFILSNNLVYTYAFTLLWIGIVVGHLYFNGCIITKIERKLLNDKKWKGPWVVISIFMEMLGFKINNHECLYIGSAIVVTLFIILKLILLNNKK